MLRKEQEMWPSMRMGYIRAAIEVASNQENVDLSRTTGALLDIIEEDSNSENRRMAVQALHEIGPDHVGEQRYRQAMGQLHALMQAEKSKQVRDAAARALTQYTG